MKKQTMTEDKAKQTPAGGVLVGKREGQTIIHDKGTQGGYFVGKLHKEGGIKGINKSTGQPIEVQGGEVIITAPAVADQTKREFEGEMLTNREILSKINEKGGGVSLENGGEIYYTGSSYNYGGKTMTDYEIMQSMNDCGCENEYNDGGNIKTYKNKYNKKYGYTSNESHDLEEIAKDTGISLKGLQQIYNKGIGAYKTNPESVRPNVKSKEQWAMARVYSAVMGGKASKVDSNELKMNNGGQMNLAKESKKGDHPSRDLNNYNDLMDVEADGMVGAESGLFAYGGRVSNSKLFMPSVRGGWTKEKIIKYQKSHSSDTTSTLTLLKYISEFSDWEQFKNHIYYHGTQSYIEKGLKPSITMSEREVERIGGGGYGQRYFGVSLTKRKRTAESFSGMSNGVIIYPVILKRDAKVIERTDLQDASEIEDIIVELYEKGVDAVYIGGGEEELVVVNPFSVLLYKNGREYHSVFGGFKSVPLTDEKIKEIYNNSKILSDKYIEEYNSKQNKEDRDQFTKSIPNIQFEKGGLMNQDIRYATGGNLKPYDANMDGDSADTMYKEGGGVDVVIEDGWKVTRYNDGKEIYKKIDEKYSYEILKNKRGEVSLTVIVLSSIHGESFNRTYSDVITEYFDSVEKAKKYVEENYEKMNLTTNKNEAQSFSAEVFEWDKVPTNYRNINKVKKVPFTNNPMDKALDSIISPFLGKDISRQSVMGVNFDENGITATNLHMLITLPYPNEKYNGIYDITGAKKQKSKDLLLINQNYPNYEAIITKSENAGTPYEVNVYKLLQYSKTAINYANKTTKAIAFKFGDNQSIGFNSTLLTELLTASLKLGHEKLYAFISAPNMAMLLSPNKDYELGNDDILLIMPIMLTSTYGTSTGYKADYGAEDIDYKRSLKAYFDFNDSEIHNADGSVAEFKMQYENNLSVDDSYLGLLNKIANKNQKLAILNYAKVENGKMTATDLDISLIVKDVNMPNGIYEIVNKAPNITMNPIEDFPSERVFDKNEFYTIGNVFYNKNETPNEKRPTAFEFVTFSEVFEFYLDKLLLSVGKNDLRPVMSGICIKKTAQNEIFLVTTNANTLCKINITEYCEFDKDDRELEYILPVKYLKDFVKLADGSLHFKCSQANIFIEAENLEFIGKTIDGKYPNYDAVIPKDNSKKIVFDHVAMNKCLKSPEFVSKIAKYKTDKSIIFDLVNEGNFLFLKVTKEIRFNVEYQLVDKIQLCEIDFNYEQVNTNINLDESVFLLMPSKDEFKENQYFSFRKEFFDVMLETITDTEVECYFSEPNRAYIFPIDAIDYKKTLPVEKTKQQKLSKADIKQIIELEEMKDVLEPMVEDKLEFEEIIDLGNNFEIRVEKVFYESGDSTYGASLYYKNYIFKYFVFLSNTSKKEAIDNVYKYLKTLRVSDKILENAPKKGEFTVFYNDRGGEHRRIEDSKNEIEQFIKAVNSITNKPIETNESKVEKEKVNTKKYVIESKGFTQGIGSSSYKEKRKKQIEDLKKQTETNELQEAIETLEILFESSKGKDKKEIKEALEILKMLNEN